MKQVWVDLSMLCYLLHFVQLSAEEDNSNAAIVNVSLVSTPLIAVIAWSL